MRESLLVLALTSFALATSARAQDADPSVVPAPSPAPGASSTATSTVTATPATVPPGETKMQLGLAFLPMVLGKVQGGNEALMPAADAATAYGIGASFGYNVLPGVSVGVAPQVLFNVKPKDDANAAAIEYDLLARIAYARPVAPGVTIYAEVLPGYSVIMLPSQLTNIEGASVSNPKGLVVAFGAGASMDVSDRFFVNLGLGFQLGSQKGSIAGTSFTDKTKFVRIALGGGMKF
jgi:hypothetical protein